MGLSLSNAIEWILDTQTHTHSLSLPLSLSLLSSPPLTHTHTHTHFRKVLMYLSSSCLFCPPYAIHTLPLSFTFTTLYAAFSLFLSLSLSPSVSLHPTHTI